MLSRPRILALLTTAALIAPASVVAAPYSFSLTPTPALFAPVETNHPGSFTLVAPATLTTAPANPFFYTGDYSEAWITLPGGAAFTQLAGTVSDTSHGVNVTTMLSSTIVVRSGTGAVTTIFSHEIQTAATTSAWAYNASTRPGAVGLEVSATGSGSCGVCSATLTSLTGTVEDAQPPTSVTLDPLPTPAIVNTRTLPLTWHVTDDASGPGAVSVLINAQRQPSALWTAPVADPSYLTGQRTGGLATATGTNDATLPDQDGTYNLQIVGADAVGNEATSSPIRVTLDRQPPTVDVFAPSVWCTAPCPVTIHTTDVVTGLASITATTNGTPIALPQPAGENELAWTIDAATLAQQGPVTITVAVTDRAGNTHTVDIPVLVDTQPPQVAGVVTDPDARTVTLDVAEASGIASASLQIGTTALTLQPNGAPVAGHQTLTATVPGLGFPTLLDGVHADAALTDQAGNHTNTPVTFRRRAQPTLTATLTLRRLLASTPTTISGQLSAVGLGTTAPVIVTLANANWPGYDHTWRLTATTGRYTLPIIPTISGTLTLSYPGSSDVAPATITIGRVVVVPRITASFRLRHGHAVVTGHFTPTSGPPIELHWQARTGHTGPWTNVCTDNDTLTVHHGRFSGRCSIALGPNVQLRIVYRPSAGGAYASAASGPARAR